MSPISSAFPGDIYGQQDTFTGNTQNNNVASRVFSLDVLRGLALPGILLVSIWEFGGFSLNKQTSEA
jgi:uncharacterized membrane protein YeiB